MAVPAFNCEKQISRLIDELGSTPLLAQLRSQIFQIRIFDNQSSDQTVAAANLAIQRTKLSDWMVVTENSQNLGLGGTQKQAFTWALDMGFSHLIVFHGDNQGSIQDIPAVLEVLSGGAKIALGSRFMNGSRRFGYSKTRVVGNRILNLFFSLCTGIKILDLGSGLNGFSLDAFSNRRYLSFSNAFNFNVDLLLDFIGRKIPLIFVPIQWREEDQVSNARNFRVAFSMLKSLMRWLGSKEPVGNRP
jgi:dolichol-phosphate mannosyltransferase